MGAFSCTIFPALEHHCARHHASILPNLFILLVSSKHVCHVQLLVGRDLTLLLIQLFHVLSLSASYIVLLLSNFLGIVLGPHPRFILIRVVLLYFTWYQITWAITVWSQISLFFSPANMVICMLYNHDFVSHLSIKIINTCVFLRKF